MNKFFKAQCSNCDYIEVFRYIQMFFMGRLIFSWSWAMFCIFRTLSGYASRAYWLAVLRLKISEVCIMGKCQHWLHTMESVALLWAF